jgi:ribosomal protein S27AE
MNWTENEIQVILENYEIKGPTILSKELNRTPRAIGRKAKDLGLKFNQSLFYQSDEFDKVVSRSKNIVDICRNLELKLTGGNRNTVKKWIILKNLDTSHFYIERKVPSVKKYSLDEICVEKSTYIHTTNLKDRLYKEGIKNRECELCGQGEFWKGKKMSLILDHINGDKFDNRVENLRIVCPNCNATLETNGGKNIKNKLKQTTIGSLA